MGSIAAAKDDTPCCSRSRLAFQRRYWPSGSECISLGAAAWVRMAGGSYADYVALRTRDGTLLGGSIAVSCAYAASPRADR